MFTLLLALLACDETATSATGSPAWSSVYGDCGTGTQNIVTADDLGEPLAMLVEIEVPNGWVPLSLSLDNLSTPLLYRTAEGGLWLDCPEGSFGWHVSWAR
jgi:hypothetical protein